MVPRFIHMPAAFRQSARHRPPVQAAYSFPPGTTCAAYSTSLPPAISGATAGCCLKSSSICGTDFRVFQMMKSARPAPWKGLFHSYTVKPPPIRTIGSAPRQQTGGTSLPCKLETIFTTDFGTDRSFTPTANTCDAFNTLGHAQLFSQQRLTPSAMITTWLPEYRHRLTPTRLAITLNDAIDANTGRISCAPASPACPSAASNLPKRNKKLATMRRPRRCNNHRHRPFVGHKGEFRVIMRSMGPDPQSRE